MHALLGGQQRWAGISGIATEGDFVEVPSQMLEEFFRDPHLLAIFAHHYETDEPIPAELVQKMNQAGAFGRADWVRTQLFYTTYSLMTHTTDPAMLDLDELFQQLYARFLPYQWIDGNHMYAASRTSSGIRRTTTPICMTRSSLSTSTASSLAPIPSMTDLDEVLPDGARPRRLHARQGDCDTLPRRYQSTDAFIGSERSSRRQLLCTIRPTRTILAKLSLNGQVVESGHEDGPDWRLEESPERTSAEVRNGEEIIVATATCRWRRLFGMSRKHRRAGAHPH